MATLFTRFGVGLTFVFILVSVASAQRSNVAGRLVEYGRMEPAQANETVRRVSAVLASNAAQGGDRYDPIRRQVNQVLYGPEAGPGATREEYNRRLGEVLARLTAGLDAELLEVMFAVVPNAAIMCSHNFGITIGECDSLIAAATRQTVAFPYVPPSDGAELSESLRSSRVNRADATQIVRALRTAMLGLPGNLTDDEAGHALLALVEACPGGLTDREGQLRAWHVGPTEGMARCIAQSLGPSGAAGAEQLLGMNVRAASAFVAWGSAGAGTATIATTRGAPPPTAAGRAAPPVARTSSDLPAQPELAERWRQEARRHFEAQHFSQAAAAYEAAATLDPNNAGTHAGLGAARLAMGDAASAVVAYQQAVRLAPTESRYHSALGRALVESGDQPGAILALQRSYQLDPSNQAAQDGLRALGAAPAGVSPPPRVAATPPPSPRPVLTPVSNAPPPRPTPGPPPPVAAPAGIPETPSRDTVIATMRPLQEALVGCAPSFSGQIAFEVVVVGNTGEVREASLVSGDITDPAQQQCLEGIVRSASFPRFTRDTLTVTYPFDLAATP